MLSSYAIQQFILHMIYTIYTIPQPTPYKILLLMMLECSYANSDRIPLEF